MYLYQKDTILISKDKTNHEASSRTKIYVEARRQAFICEIVSVTAADFANVKIVQIINGSTYTVGDLFRNEYLVSGIYTYLSGQDVSKA